jgi:hypothetical protein
VHDAPVIFISVPGSIQDAPVIFISVPGSIVNVTPSSTYILSIKMYGLLSGDQVVYS